MKPTYETPVYRIQVVATEEHDVHNNPAEVYFGDSARLHFSEASANAGATDLGETADSCDWGECEPPEYYVEKTQWGYLSEDEQAELADSL